TRGGRARDGSASQGHMPLSNVKRARRSQSQFGGLNIRKQFFIGHQMPDCSAFALFNRDDAQQSKTAFELKDEIIARCERLGHSRRYCSASCQLALNHQVAWEWSWTT